MERDAGDCHLKLHCIWKGIGWALVALVVVLSLTTNPPGIVFSVPYSDKVGHMLAYLLVTFWFVQIERRWLYRFNYAIFLILLGIGLEWLQGLGGVRQFERADMLANASGVIVALLLGLTPLQYLLRGIERRLYG